MPPSPRQDSGRFARFATTRWSVVLAAQGKPAAELRDALAVLCETYWYPLYAFVRRRGSSPADAQDLTQEFFATLLEKGYVDAADPARGRFRTFLLTAFSRFLSKQWQRTRARKRGGDVRTLPLDFATGEARYQLEPADPWTPEKLYQRRWTLTLLDRVLQRMAEDAERQGRSPTFERLKPFLTSAEGNPRYEAVAADLGMSPGAVKVAVHRLRRRYRELLMEEIAGTVTSPDELEDELSQLLSALRGEA